MRRFGDLLARHGLALLLTGAAMWMLLSATLPALRDRGDVRARRQASEQALEREQADVQRAELWLAGSREDPMLKERLRDSLELSPELPGPRVSTTPEGDGQPDGR